jgi:hypothetical protein
MIMAETVTIEGSQTPSVELKRGHRRTVRMTPRIQRLVDKGFVIVVSRSGGEYDLTPEETADADAQDAADDESTSSPVPEPDDATDPDSSRDEWRSFLSSQKPPVPYPEDADATALAAIWQAASGGS